MKRFLMSIWISIIFEHLSFWGWVAYHASGKQGLTLALKIGPDEDGMYSDIVKQWGVK